MLTIIYFMKRYFFSFILLLICGICVAAKDKVVTVSAEYDYTSNNDESPSQAKRNAFEAAKAKALEDRFGADVSKVTHTIVTNQQNGEDARSETSAFSYGGTEVRGRWIETTKEEVLEMRYVEEGNFWIIKVRIEGKAQEISKERADVQYTFVRNINDTEAPVTFRDGNSIFLRFTSPISGYLCVYLVDENNMASCMLPYMTNTTGSQRVEANEEYVFFSSDLDANAQDYELSCEGSSESCALILIFSPNEFIKAPDRRGGVNFRNQPLLRELPYGELQKWLARNQAKDEDMVVKQTIITIKK